VSQFVAVAHPNIALAKYWGKLDPARNLPAVPSLSLTLDAMSTTTSVELVPDLAADTLELNGMPGGPEAERRVGLMLDRVRAAAGVSTRARVQSRNDFPTASGLASSASGFAALALAAVRAAGLDWTMAQVSDLARQSSASAARSLYGGFVTLAAGRVGDTLLAAEPVPGASGWDVAITVVVTTHRPKATGSTDGMGHTARTSPFYASWVEHAPVLFQRAVDAVRARDIEALGLVTEASAFAMHASAMAASPALIYFSPATLTVIDAVRELRRAGTLAFVTMDAGPHVKVLSLGRDAPSIARAMEQVVGVERVIVARPGSGPELATLECAPGRLP
jgi:diphosphomevalonate decarboxylase